MVAARHRRCGGTFSHLMITRRLFLAVAATLTLGVAAVPASAQAAPPANDAFARAQPLTLNHRVAGTLVDATVEPGEPDHANDRRAHSVWYSYTPSADGAVTFDACDAQFDTVIATYTGPTLAGLTAGPSVDDACNDLASKVSLQVKAGVTVWVAVAGVKTAVGPFSVVVRPETLPPNDDFAEAIAVRPGRVRGTNVLAGRALGDPELADVGGGSVWYRYRTSVAQRITLDTTGSTFDTVLGVYTGEPGELRRIAVDDDSGPGDAAELSFTARPKRTYWIMVDGFQGSRGSIDLGISDGSIAAYGVKLGAPASAVLSDVVAHGLRTDVACRRACPLNLELRVSEATARRIGLPRKEGRVLARTTANGRGERLGLTAVLRFSDAARRALRGEDPVKASLRAELRGTRSSRRFVARPVTLGAGT
jgi:hypothetical protein